MSPTQWLTKFYSKFGFKKGLVDEQHQEDEVSATRSRPSTHASNGTRSKKRPAATILDGVPAKRPSLISEPSTSRFSKPWRPELFNFFPTFGTSSANMDDDVIFVESRPRSSAGASHALPSARISSSKDSVQEIAVVIDNQTIPTHPEPSSSAPITPSTKIRRSEKEVTRYAQRMKDPKSDRDVYFESQDPKVRKSLNHQSSVSNGKSSAHAGKSSAFPSLELLAFKDKNYVVKPFESSIVTRSRGPPSVQSASSSSRRSLPASSIAPYRTIHEKLFESSKRKMGFSGSRIGLAGRKNQAIDDTVRLQEREEYAKLLRSTTRGLNYKPRQPVANFSALLASYSPDQPCTPRERGKVEFVDLEAEDNEKNELTLVKYTRPSTKSDRRSLVNLTDTDEVKELSKVCTPKPSSLDKELARSPFVDKGFVADLYSRYGTVERDRERQARELELRKLAFEEENKTILSNLERSVEKYVRITAAIEEFPEELPELTEEMEELINDAFNPYPKTEVLVEAFNMPITRKDVQTLSGLSWLNDEVINFYLTLISERSKQGGKYPPVYNFSTFFYPKLMSGGHSALKRWTRKVDIFAHDIVLVPVHLGMHWCLAVIDMKEKAIRYYDSMAGRNESCLTALLRYLQDESKEKNKNLNFSSWTTECVRDIPQQMNGSDCGMFACKFAEYASRRAPFTFTQEHMPYFRRRMVYEILSKQLLSP